MSLEFNIMLNIFYYLLEFIYFPNARGGNRPALAERITGTGYRFVEVISFEDGASVQGLEIFS